MNYAQHVSRKTDENTQKFVINDWDRLERFLILGAENGTYTAGKQELIKENATCVERLLADKEEGIKVVDKVVQISDSGRAPKNDPAIFVLALAAASKHDAVRAEALESLPKVCRTGTHLFHFVAMVNELRGWGRGLRKAIANWYNDKPTDKLAYQLVKYQQRDGWSHKDLLRLSHAGASCQSETHQAAFRWVVDPDNMGKRKIVRYGENGESITTYEEVGELPRIIKAYEQIKRATSVPEVVDLIQTHRLTHEMVPNDFKNSKEVWEALVQSMPLGALVRNLGKLTSIGLIAPFSEHNKLITEQLTDVERIRKARLHPLAILNALKIYSQGRGMRGSLTWSPNQKIVDALDAGFYTSFDAVEPTGKNLVVALDASGSMNTRFGDSPLRCIEAACAMAMVVARTEENHHLLYFSSSSGGYYHRKVQTLDGVADLPISPNERLDDMVNRVLKLNWGGTDCALPMLWADHNKVKADGFIVLTDNDTWAGNISPAQALNQFRTNMDRPAKSVVVGMTPTKFSIANPNDSGMLDVVGFDTSTPSVISDFFRN